MLKFTDIFLWVSVMVKKIVIVCGFLAFFGVALMALFKMKGVDKPVLEHEAVVDEVQNIGDSVHSYSVAELTVGCQSDDKIFCAIEQTVKCTMKPDFAGCHKDFVPGFVIGKTDETPRPTQIAFEIVKIKPIPETNDISVYTKSDCDAVWFGLCKGTVIYSLTQKGNRWAVTNIYALE